MQNHRKLRVYRESQTLAVQVYRVAKLLPRDERFELGSQLRSAAVSVGSNIAEGCGRFTSRDLACFLDRALASATELEFQLEHCELAELVPRGRALAALESAMLVQRLLTSFIQSVRGDRDQ